MWHHPQFAGGCWDGSATAPGTGVEFASASAAVMSTDTAGATYNHHPASVYGCSFSAATGSGSGTGTFVGSYDGSTPGSAPPYYGMYNLPSLAAASPWSTGHAPSLGYNAVRRQFGIGTLAVI